MPMKKLSNKILVLVLISFWSYGQTPKRCALDDMPAKYGRNKVNELQQKIEEFYLKKGGRPSFENEVLKIPIVVHVIHHSTSPNPTGGQDDSNISDEQIISQIRVLNEDYRRKIGTLGYNNSPVGADMQIEFYLATTDPKGNISSGINRVYNSKLSFDVFEDLELLSSLSYWDSNKYLNIWVTSLKNSYLGYGQFPGAKIDGLDYDDVEEKIDGVFIEHSVFGSQTGTATTGSYSYGRTLTHEIGHWLGLLHTWGDEFCGDDYCADTPRAEKGNNTLNCRPVFSTCGGTKTQNMIENYLDYTIDSCMNIFTSDQKNRVRAVLELSARRKRLIENSKFSLPSASELSVKIINNPSGLDKIDVQVLVNDYKNIELVIYSADGKIIQTKSFKDSPSRLISIQKNDTGSGVFILKVISGAENYTSKFIFL
jgi:hypothetical protein